MEKQIRHLTHQECHTAAYRLSQCLLKIQPFPKEYRLYGVPRGGIPVAYLVSGFIPGAVVVDKVEQSNVVIDDIVDSGTTRRRYTDEYNLPFLDLARFLEEPHKSNQWIVFPWEKTANDNDTSADDIVIRLLQYVGEDPSRAGLVDTPKRVLKAWKEMTVGYSQDPKKILARTFPAETYDEIIACTWIEFNSVCEHHLLPFLGTAHVAYLPAEQECQVVGLSKLARLVDCFARRLQIQEQMTLQIANALEKELNPRGVAVVLQAKHLCMACRGVQKHKSVMVTSAMRGVFKNNPAARQEFFSLIELSNHQNGK